jgi:hypothetical protein
MVSMNWGYSDGDILTIDCLLNLIFKDVHPNADITDIKMNMLRLKRYV